MSQSTATPPHTNASQSRLHGLGWLAMVGAVATSALAFADAVTVAVSGENLIGEGDAVSSTLLLNGLVHGLTYVVLGWLLVFERRRIDAGSRVRTTARWALTGSYLLLLPFFLLGLLQVALTRSTIADLPTVYEVTAGIGFAGMFLSSIVLGFALWKATDLRLASRTLSLGVLAGIGATILLALVASDWSHPAYAEAAVYLGTALLALRPTQR